MHTNLFWVLNVQSFLCSVLLKHSTHHAVFDSQYMKEGRKMFYLTTHSTHFIYGYMASDRTIQIAREETRCRHMGYSFRLTARVLLYAPSHRQDSTYHSLCYTSRGALAGTRNSSMGPPPQYMKLFDAKPNAICPFGLHIKQFLTASNIDFSNILGTSCWIWCIWRITQMHRSINNYYDYIPVYTGNSVACTSGFFFIKHNNTWLGIYLHCWSMGIIKALEQIKDSTVSKIIIYTDSLLCPSFKIYGISLDCNGNKDIFFVGSHT